jgi:hypothetical protein
VRTASPVRARRDADAAVRQAEPVRGFGRRQTRYECEENGGNDRQRHTHPQERGVDGHVEGADGKSRGIPRQNRHHWPGNHDRQCRTGAAQQEALGQQCPPQSSSARAQRRPNGQLAFTPNGARENQIGHVGARDDENQRRRRKQHEQDRPRR